MHIDSPTHPLIKATAALKERKARQAKGLILVEGQHPIEEALSANLPIKSLFVQTTTELNWPTGVETIPVSEKAMRKLCTTDSPPPCLAIFEAPVFSLDTLLQTPQSLLLVLSGLQDPGNLGTLLRSAAAFGVQGIISTPGTAELYSPKVIRSAAGILFRLPMVSSTLTVVDLLAWLHEKGYQILSTTGHTTNSRSYRAVSYTGACALVMGSEGTGLPPEALQPPYQGITIPMASGIESLNVGVSGSIILAEAAIQRGLLPSPQAR